MSEEDIDRYFVPKTASERRKQKMDQAKDFEEMSKEFQKMKDDISFLLKEVKQLRGGDSQGSNAQQKTEKRDPASSNNNNVDVEREE